MKKFLFCVCVFFSLFFANLTKIFCEENSFMSADFQDFDYSSIVFNLTKAGPPRIEGNFLIFTAEKGKRFVGIAFDFEDFREVHAFKIHNLYDDEGKIKDTIFFYILKFPKNLKSISYRLILDGLWTCDPLNDSKFYSEKCKVLLSKINLNSEEEKITAPQKNGATKFVCFAQSGQKIRLGGTFTSWDSWIYELKEVFPGRYEIEIPLAPGEYYYAYYIGMNSFPDDTNPQKVYTSDGKTASFLKVE